MITAALPTWLLTAIGTEALTLPNTSMSVPAPWSMLKTAVVRRVAYCIDRQIYPARTAAAIVTVWPARISMVSPKLVGVWPLMASAKSGTGIDLHCHAVKSLPVTALLGPVFGCRTESDVARDAGFRPIRRRDGRRFHRPLSVVARRIRAIDQCHWTHGEDYCCLSRCPASLKWNCPWSPCYRSHPPPLPRR